MSIVVSNAAELTQALNNATGGETIVLKAGDYGDFAYSGKSFTKEVTITSQDPKAQAAFSGFTLSNVSNVTVEKVTFDHDAASGEAVWQRPFQLENVDHVKIANCKFLGDKAEGLGTADDGYGTGTGLAVWDSKNVTVEGNSFNEFYRGAVFGGSSNIKVLNNDIRNMSSDGMDFNEVKGVLIKGNSIHDFAYSPNADSHADMIQFWTSGTTSPSSDIRIVKNFLYQGDGDVTQSIFMRNEMVDSGLAGAEMFYSNVVIAGNVIRNSHYHGITVGETDGLTIENNTLLQNISAIEGGGISVPSINVALASAHVEVLNNIAPRFGDMFDLPHSGWQFDNNLIVQIDNPRAANYVGHIFADGLDISHPEWADFTAIEGSIADQLGAGAILGGWGLNAAAAAGRGEPWGYVTAADGDVAGFLVKFFEVSAAVLGQSKLDLTGANVVWDFGDNTVGAGLAVGHTYHATGEYTVATHVTLSDGTAFDIEKTIEVVSANYMDVSFENGAVDASDVVNTLLSSDGTSLCTRRGDSFVKLEGGHLAFEASSQFIFDDDFTLSADFKKLKGMESEGGQILYKSGSFNIAAGRDNMTANIVTSAGVVTLFAEGVGIENAKWHRVAVTFDGKDGVAKLVVDGHVVDRVTGLAGSVLAGPVSSEFCVGSPFGNSLAGYVDDVHFIGDGLSLSELRADDPVQKWTQDGLNHFVVAADGAGVHAVDLSAFMSPRDIADALSNSYLGLLSGTDFQII